MTLTALQQQQAQLPWLAWLALLPLCIGLAMRRDWRFTVRLRRPHGTARLCRGSLLVFPF
jgi:hypothetical protein